jgi:succinate dehydrogenase / fumarate reductase cytochrome b subunit
VATTSSPSFFARHEFLILRLHSLSGLLPVGMYMVVHLLTNASVLGGAASFQKNVDTIHSLGPALPLVEWTFIFLPILFHAIVGVVIIRSGRSNSSRYAYSSNIRYTLQRATAWIALVFILWHVFHMHGWIHLNNETWNNTLHKLNGGNFNPEQATSTLAEAMASPLARIAYLVGVAACVYHFANGLWTMGITWGVWQSAAAQRRANWVCAGVGLFVLAAGAAAWIGAQRINVDAAKAYEMAVHNQKVQFEEDEKRIEADLQKKKLEDADAKPGQPVAKAVSTSNP